MSISKENKFNTRVSWIDTLRTISIFLVVYIHTGRRPDAIVPYVTPFFMPVFFFISGLFVKESIKTKSFLNFAKSRARRLLIPYLTFGIISYLNWFFLTGRIDGNVELENPIIFFLINTIYGVGGYKWLDYNITLWFFPCLLVVELIFFFLIRLPSRRIIVVALFVLSLIGYFYFDFFNIRNFRLPFGIDIATTAVVFYGIGYFVSPYLLNNNVKLWYTKPFIALAAFCYIIFSNLNGSSAFVIGNFGKNYFYFYLAALSGILFWTQISRVVKPNKILEEIGKNTLVIFPLHLLIFPYFTGILVYLFKIPKDTLDSWSFLGLLYAIMAILILIPMSWGLNRYVPFFLGKRR